ncbi:MAG TPA: hypothetical protein VK929_08825 [Longimicrobiales bacterium]|nr:hypothetical protein [Longimicrobiales bacterium]
MRRLIPAGLGLAMILAGCGAELPVEPYSAFSAQGGDAELQANHQTAPVVPIRGTCDLEAQPPQPTGPGLIQQRDVGTCHISHLGKSTVVSDKVINLMAGTQDAEMVITAANGDMLYLSGSGTNAMVAPGQVAFRVELTITGGTGRFTGATGTVLSQGTADLATAQAKLSMAGTISY